MLIGQPTIWENGTDIVPLDQTCCLLQPFIHQSLEVPSIVFIYFGIIAVAVLLSFGGLIGVTGGGGGSDGIGGDGDGFVLFWFLFWFIYLFWDRLLCNSSWPGIYCALKAVLEYLIPRLYLLNMFLSKEFTYVTKVKWQKSGHLTLVIIT